MNTKQLTQSYGEYINSFPYDHYAILTFRHEETVSKRLAFHAFNLWKVGLKKQLNHPIQYFMVMQNPRYKGDEHIHLHVLLQGTSPLSSEELQSKWEYGISKVSNYDSTLGVSYYLGNQWVNDSVEVLMSKNLGKN